MGIEGAESFEGAKGVYGICEGVWVLGAAKESGRNMASRTVIREVEWVFLESAQRK